MSRHLHRDLLVVVLAGALGACSSLDEAVVPTVTAAAIAVDPAAPTQPASVAISLVLEAGSRADRAVELHEVVLIAPDAAVTSAPLATLVMAFPSSFDGAVSDGERRSVVLDNAGTTNEVLAPLCGQPVEVVVSIAYPDEPGTRELSAPFGLGVECP